jgi:UDPglucose 6-dehydrogenase
MTICVMGLGFVGLTTALGFASRNWAVAGFDIARERIAALGRGQVPFHEPDLPKALARYLENGRFRLADTVESAMTDASAAFICVGTSVGADGSVDLIPLKAAVNAVLGHVERRRYCTIVIKSTVPPATVSRSIRPEVERRGLKIGRDVGLAVNPEFLREGRAWEDFTRPDRIVIGADDERSAAEIARLYEGFEAPIRVVSTTTAEFVKCASNAFLASMISYANEMAMAAEAIGSIDIPAAFKILHEDKRWRGDPAPMSQYLYPGCGFGGYCLPKDTAAIRASVARNGASTRMLDAVLETNRAAAMHAIGRIVDKAKPDDGIGVLGLAFKPGSDDTRGTVSAVVIEELQRRGYRRILAHDPMATGNFAALYPDLKVEFVEKLEDIVQRAQWLVLLTAWAEYGDVRADRERVIDCRYVL